MPTPPSIDGLEDIHFITNYFLMGCSPPSYLVVDFSQAPLTDVALLFVSFDYQDIAQAWLNPSGQRNRRSGRHGRKRLPFGGQFPDINDMVGTKLHCQDLVRGIRMTPLRYIFPILNIYEGISFFAAVADGITDVGFDTLWGVLRVDPNHCRQFKRLSKATDGSVLVGGAGQHFRPFAMNVTEFNNGFFDGAFGTSTDVKYTIALRATLIGAGNPGVYATGTVVLADAVGNIFDESGEYSLLDGDTFSVNLSATLVADQQVFWQIKGPVSFVRVFAEAIAYGLADIFQ